MTTKITILAIGKLRGSEAEWATEYLKRLGRDVAVKEFSAPKNLPPAPTQKAEHDWLAKVLPIGVTLILLDERGRDLPSRDFATAMQEWHERGPLAFVIGGADGVLPEMRDRADFTLGFGRATWPHRLVRIMLLEQIYRARQIVAGHPYHRD